MITSRFSIFKKIIFFFIIFFAISSAYPQNIKKQNKKTEQEIKQENFYNCLRLGGLSVCNDLHNKDGSLNDYISRMCEGYGDSRKACEKEVARVLKNPNLFPDNKDDGSETKPPIPKLLEGDERLACEAILCLSSPLRPEACMPSLRRFFGIVFRKWHKTLQARTDFLNLCPHTDTTGQVARIVETHVKLGSYCMVDDLNAVGSWGTFRGKAVFMISPNMPSHCAELYGDPIVISLNYQPVFVGEPIRGGKWVYPSEYASELAAYLERIAREDAEYEKCKENKENSCDGSANDGGGGGGGGW